MGVAIALILSAAFGAGDQYLGARVPGWGLDVAQLSAAWILLPFAVGATRRDPLRAALLGLACTYVALAGYGLMTLSPVEGAHITVAGARSFVIANHEWFIGGAFTGPLFGWFGQQWRSRKMVAGALLVAAAFCFEPLARRFGAAYQLSRPVTVAEIAAGVMIAAAILFLYRRQRA